MLIDRYEQFLRLRAFIGFDDKDAETLRQLGPVLIPEQTRITDEFYTTILREPETAAFTEGRLEALKKTHARWFEELFQGAYDREYFENRWRIGLAHVRVGLNSRWVDLVMSCIHDLVLTTLQSLQGSDGVQAHRSVARVLELDRVIMQLAYDEDRLDRLSEFTGMKRALIENIVRIPRR